VTASNLNDDVDLSGINNLGFDVVNLVATINLNQELDLRQLASDLPASEYHPERFPFLVYRPEQSDATALIPTNGTVSISGAKNKEQLIKTTKNLLSNLSKLGIQIDIDVDSLELQNVVATGELDVELDLATVTIGLGVENCEYEPEQFPGVIYRKPELPVVLLFSSGKIVVTGAKSYKQALEACEAISEDILALFGNESC